MTLDNISHQTVLQLKTVCSALEDKKVMELKILDVSASSSITNYFVLASGNSVPQLKALAASVEKALKVNNIGILGVESDSQSGWVVIDGFDFMVHIFLPEVREAYALEVLWKDAKEIAPEALIAG